MPLSWGKRGHLKWIEIINARLAFPSDTAEAERLIADIRNSLMADEDKNVKLMIYRGLFVDSDWAIHLHRETPGKPSGRTGLGIRLAETIRSVALVDHSIWIEDDETFSHY